MYAKFHKTKYEVLLAVCDEGLIGKNLTSYFCVNPYFYKGKRVNEEKLKEFLKEATIINLLGKKCVEIAIKEKFVNEGSVTKIKGIPHAQVICMKVD